MSLLSTRINLDAISHNVRLLKDLVGPDVRLMCVVKADAYGHGVERVAPVMLKAGADVLGCATVDEAVALRKLGIDAPLVAWMWEPQQDLSDALSSDIVIGVPSLAHAKTLVEIEVPVKVVIKVETGMHRSGVDRQLWDEVFALLADAPHIEVTGLMSHLACADEPENPHTDVQAAEFREAIARARELGLECPINHLANSPATLSRKDLHFDQVRVGLASYGLEPIAGVEHSLQPAMTWAANIINVKPIKQGESSCYGLTWTAPADGYLAVVPVGYADGLPRSVQGSLNVTIGGKSYPQVGRVSMDQIVVDLGENPFGVQADDEAIIFGEGGQSATELADAIGTINYEVVCRPTGRTKRIYEGGIDL
ncbi:MAG: alanine racemase [Corynebacterium casei]|uniref:alanine racemase n=1 Tax=Corynebacterium casei TaxID=160386 RepID=UPI003F907FEE